VGVQESSAGVADASSWDRSNEIILDRRIGLDFYAMIANFEACYQNNAFCVGLRATESPNRWRTVTKNPVLINGEPIFWATGKDDNVAFYPLCDWNQSDVWKYTYERKLRYSKVYDYMFRKGMHLNEIRTSSLIHERSFKALVELPEFEPKTYNKLQKRIKGISFAQETGKNAMMFKAKKLPQNFKSWRAYRDFLLETYPEPAKKEIFAKRFALHLDNEYVARQQVRQLVLCDIENNVAVINRDDPRKEWVKYYMENL
jgi:predicted phosphoadenosine phosphosulfate sulfurtransferase